MQLSQPEPLGKSVEWFPRKIFLWYNTENSFCCKNGKKKGDKMCELKRKRNWNRVTSQVLKMDFFLVDHDNTEFLMQKAFENRKEGIQCARKAQEDMSFIAFLFFSAPLIRTMRKVRHELWRLFWQYRHCCSDTWQTKQGDHPHRDLTGLLVGPENGQLAVKEVHVSGGEKVRHGVIWYFHIFQSRKFQVITHIEMTEQVTTKLHLDLLPPPLLVQREDLAVSSIPWSVPGLTVLLPLFLSVAVNSTEKLLCNES